MTGDDPQGVLGVEPRQQGQAGPGRHRHVERDGLPEHVEQRQTVEDDGAAYARERENWLRNRSAARAGRIRGLLSGARIDVRAAEATLGYRLRQYHVGVVCWTGGAAASADNITRLDRALREVAGLAACSGDPLYLPRDESSAWAWLPLGIRDTFASAAASTAGVDGDIHFAFGDVEKGTAGFRLTHQQAVAAQSVALAAGSPRPRGRRCAGRSAPGAAMRRGWDCRSPRALPSPGGSAGHHPHALARS